MQKLSQKSDDEWLFRCYDTGGRKGFHEWYDGQGPQDQASIDAMIGILEGTKDWKMPEFKALEGACKGLEEIRIDREVANDDETADGSAEKMSIRLIGFSGPGRKEFTLLTGFKKVSGSEYGVECPRAYGRKQRIRGDERRAPRFEN